MSSEGQIPEVQPGGYGLDLRSERSGDPSRLVGSIRGVSEFSFHGVAQRSVAELNSRFVGLPGALDRFQCSPDALDLRSIPEGMDLTSGLSRRVPTEAQPSWIFGSLRLADIGALGLPAF